MPTAFLDHPGPMAFAHRGGAAHAPENTWRAFEHALGLGYRYLETDLQATADGVLVTFHDRTLARVTDRGGRIARLPYQAVAQARIGGTEAIPRLDDLLAAWPDVRFNIDLKDAPVIEPLAGVLRRTRAWDRVCVTSFSASRLRTARRVLDRPVCMAASPFGISVVRFGGPRGRGTSAARPGPPPPTPPCPTARTWRWPIGWPVPGCAARRCRPRWPPRRSSAGRTRWACRCTPGRSTHRRSCTSCWTSGWTAS